MTEQEAILATKSIAAQFNAARDGALARRRQTLDKALNSGTGEPTMLAVACGIKAGVHKGSIFSQFAETGTISATDLTAAPQRLAPGEQDAFRAALMSQYPTIAGMHNLDLPQPAPAPFLIPASSVGSVEARYNQEAGKPDPGETQTILEALGMKVLRGEKLTRFLYLAKMRRMAEECLSR